MAFIFIVGPFVPTHSFIPTVSSLAFYKPDFNWNDNINRNLVCTGEIPFDSYFAPPVNEEHVNVTAQSVEWLLQEIEGNPQAPSYPFDENGFAFSTSSLPVCKGSTATLQVKECTFPSEIKWNVSSNLDITYQDGYSIEVKAIASGEATITAFSKWANLHKNILGRCSRIKSYPRM